MNPPFDKNWWATAAALAGTVPVAMGQVPPAPPAPSATGRQQVGVVTTTAPQAPDGVQTAPLFVDSASNQRVTNNTTGPMHILFSDQSAVTLAPNAEIFIAQYRWDAAEKRGNIAINLFKGILRVVGGQISKNNAVQVRTATATIGIRGGISIVEFKEGGETDAKFLFGQDLTFTLDGSSRANAGDGSAEGPSDVEPQRFVQQLRSGGWFTDGDSGDTGDSGQNDPSLVASITTLLTKPGWSAVAGSAALLGRIQSGTFTTESLQAALAALNSGSNTDGLTAQAVRGRGTALEALANRITNAGNTLKTVPPPPPAATPPDSISINTSKDISKYNPNTTGTNTTRS